MTIFASPPVPTIAARGCVAALSSVIIRITQTDRYDAVPHLPAITRPAHPHPMVRRPRTVCLPAPPPRTRLPP